MKAPRPQLLRRLAAFAMVGGIGFVVDASLTEAFVRLGAGPYLGRALAVAVAIAVTYVLNRRVTFRAPAAGRPGRRLRYLVVSLVSITVNYLVYALAMATVAGLRPALAVALGSAIAMTMNYLGYSRLVFRAADGA